MSVQSRTQIITNDLSQGWRQTETIEIDLPAVAGGNFVTRELVVARGTLKEDHSIDTLTKKLGVYQKDLERARSTGERVKRAVLTLLTVAVIAGCIAAMVLGGMPGLIAGGVGLGLFMLATDFILGDRLPGELDRIRPFIAPITMPFRLIHKLATYESKRADLVEQTETTRKHLAEYILENHEAIRSWLKGRINEIVKMSEAERAILDKQTNEETIARSSLRCLELRNEMKQVYAYKNQLSKSLEDARKILQTANPNDTTSAN